MAVDTLTIGAAEPTSDIESRIKALSDDELLRQHGARLLRDPHAIHRVEHVLEETELDARDLLTDSGLLG